MKGLSFVLLGLFAFQSSTFAEAIISDPLIDNTRGMLTYTPTSAAFCDDQDNQILSLLNGLLYCWEGTPQTKNQQIEWQTIKKLHDKAYAECCKNKGAKRLRINCSFDADEPDFRYFYCPYTET